MVNLMTTFDSVKLSNGPELKARIQSMRAQGSRPDDIFNFIVESGDVTPSEATKIIKNKGRSVKNSIIDGQGKAATDTSSIKLWFERERMKLPNPRHPIMLQGLAKLVAGEEIEVGRYYEASATEEEYEAMVKKDPTNVKVWINFATAGLPAKVKMEDLNGGGNNLNKSLNVLSQALERNRYSEDLWNFFLEFYPRRGSENEVREVFEDAVGFLPTSPGIWWRYYIWETMIDRKEVILSRMLVSVCLQPQKAVDPELRSSTFLAIIVMCTKHKLQSGDQQHASNCLLQFLSATTEDALQNASRNPSSPGPINVTKAIAFSILSNSDLALAWLAYVHLVYYGFLPESIFQVYPNEHLMYRDLFSIIWHPVDLDDQTLKHVESVLKTLSTHWKLFTTQENARSYVAIVRNCAQYLSAVMKKDVESVEFVKKAVRSHPSIIELQLIEQSLFDMQIKPDSTSFAFWNSVGKRELQKGSSTGVARCLVNCVRSFFEGLELVSNSACKLL
jgi:hypothetical protein